jgi:quinoprotein glucose dehydrogenase
LTAIDLNDRTVKWEVPLGTIENLKPLAPPLMLGSPITGGPLMTAGGIVFMAGGTDKKIRAFDIRDGKILWTAKLPAPGMAVPATYSVHGKQYVVIAAGGNNIVPVPIGDSIVAFSLPSG